MAAKRTSPGSLKPVVGSIVLVLGLFLLFANIDQIVAQIGGAAGASADALGSLFALGLAGWHTLQAYAFDRAGFLSGLQQTLVSFWPLILVIVGAVLLQDALKCRLAAYRAGAGSSARGIAHE